MSGLMTGLRIAGLAGLLVCLAFAHAFAAAGDGSALRAYDFRMAGDETLTRVVLRFDQKPEPHWFLLRDPHRMVVDFGSTVFEIAPESLDPRGLISHVRYGNVGEGRSRLILTAKGPFIVDDFEILANEDEPGHRMIVDITAASEARFEQALGERARDPDGATTTKKDDRLGSPSDPRDRRFTIVIDPGHGGIDDGAHGTTGIAEKTITLAFSLELRQRLAETDRYNVFMTREKDKFLRLDQRVRIARQHEADLFISVHADSIRYKGIRGATVYTVSDKASDAEAAKTAARENLSDSLAGIEVKEEKDEVADILVDLIRRETHTFSIRFARSLLGELSDSVRLIKNPHRYAGFRVLRAPDVPSVLLELGYLSNPEDEKLLRNPEWRAEAVESIISAIEAFASAKARAGG